MTNQLTTEQKHNMLLNHHLLLLEHVVTLKKHIFDINRHYVAERINLIISRKEQELWQKAWSTYHVNHFGKRVPDNIKLNYNFEIITSAFSQSEKNQYLADDLDKDLHEVLLAEIEFLYNLSNEEMKYMKHGILGVQDEE